MFYTYILRSRVRPQEIYSGSTQDLRARLAEHNAGKSRYTNKFIPWDLIFYAAFPQRSQAETFERYLKSGSGRAFAWRHLLAPAGGHDSNK